MYRRANQKEEEGNNGTQKKLQEDAAAPASLVALLKACAMQRDFHRGIQLHASILRRGLLKKDVFVGSALVNLYAKCGTLSHAQEVFDFLGVRNVVVWNALIAGYAQYGNDEEALKWYDRMQHEGFNPTAITYACVLKACGSIGFADKGQEIHGQIMRDASLEKDVIVGTALVDMYGKCGFLEKAQKVFDKLPFRNLVLWTALVAGYVQHGHSEEALKLFERMQLGGLSPDVFTFACILKACGTIRDSNKGCEIHAQIARDGLLKKDVVIGNALIDMYTKCGLLEQAQKVFEELPVRDLVSWTTLIAGYAQHGYSEVALNCYERMVRQGPSPNLVTLACILKACGSIGASDKGQEVHAKIVREGLLQKDCVIGTALVDMYGKLGLLEKAQEVFDKLLTQNIYTWNALLAAYALLRTSESVFKLFDKMVGEGKEPDLVTFTIVLNTCSHGGLLDNGQMFFQALHTGYGIIPTLEHYTCMVDLFGRAGNLDKAVTMINEMPRFANIVVWHSTMGACQKWGDMELGSWAFENAVQLDEKDVAAYVYMHNLYTVFTNTVMRNENMERQELEFLGSSSNCTGIGKENDRDGKKVSFEGVSSNCG